MVLFVFGKSFVWMLREGESLDFDGVDRGERRKQRILKGEQHSSTGS
jgi:hypothetical protein